VRILIVSKRFPQGRDLVSRPYGRFHYLAVELARQGHEVTQILLTHRPSDHRLLSRAGVTVHARSLVNAAPRTTLRWLRATTDLVQPNWVIACSDSWVAALAQSMARKAKSRVAVDAYDDFEAYMPWNFALHCLYRRALRNADLLTAAGPQLAALLDRQRRGRTPTEIIPMAADPGFVPLDRTSCRQALGLPLDVPVIGYSGGWARNRGTSMLIDVFRRLHAQIPNLCIALTGKPPAEAMSLPGVRALGYLDDDALPSFVNALDVSLVVTASTRFGRSSYPAKLYEAMACGVPVVATATDPVRWILGRNPECLVEPGDPGAFSARIIETLNRGRIDYGPRPTWDEGGARLAALLEERSRDRPDR
jgi:glycosyltransferase involved in cell wall biosynthesis